MATIIVDPGHYENYNAGVCPGYYEGNAMLTLGKYLAGDLEARGANVKMTRMIGEDNPSLSERGRMAADADLFISLHSDASDNANARGVTVYNSVQRPDSEPLAADIGTAVADVMGNQFRGVVARSSSNNPNADYLGVLRSAVAVGAKNAMLVEHGFHSNMEDCNILSDDQMLRRIAQAEAQVIAAYMGLGTGEMQQGFAYIVLEGENLYRIGQKLGIPWQDIAAANQIEAPYLIYPGQELWIPTIE